MASVTDFLRAIYDNSRQSSSVGTKSFEEWLPTGIAQNKDKLAGWGITDPASQMSAGVPDTIDGGSFMSEWGWLLPVAAAAGAAFLGPAAAGAGGAAATDTLGAIGAGTEAGGGFGAGTAGAATGGAGSTIGDLITNTPPGTSTALQTVTGGGGDASWGVNPQGGALPAGQEGVWTGDQGMVGPGAPGGQPFPLQNVGGATGAEGFLSGLSDPTYANSSWLPGLSNWQTLGLGANAIGSLIQGGSALYGAKTQANAANRATDAQVQMFNTINAQGAPYRAAGYAALGDIMSPEKQAYFNHQFGPEDLQKGLAPGYEFMRDQGLRAATNAGNAQSGLSGNTRRGLIDYATNYALNAGYQPAFNNYQTQQSNIFNRLSSIAGLGQTANQQSASAGAAISPGIAQSTQNYGTALGGGFVGAGNALAGGLNNAASWYALPSILSGRGP